MGNLRTGIANGSAAARHTQCPPLRKGGWAAWPWGSPPEAGQDLAAGGRQQPASGVGAAGMPTRGERDWGLVGHSHAPGPGQWQPRGRAGGRCSPVRRWVLAVQVLGPLVPRCLLVPRRLPGLRGLRAHPTPRPH